MNRAYFSASAQQFLLEPPVSILGRLSESTPFEVTPAQRDAWLVEIDQLRALAALFPDAYIYLEFSIPRMGRRADAVLLHQGTIYVLEFKIGAATYARSAIDQVLGYALDLKNFHETSHERAVVPILIATAATAPLATPRWYPDRVAVPILADVSTLPEAIRGYASPQETLLDPRTWEAGRYKPTPTIIEAAQALYRNHSVEEISRNEAGATNLSATAAYIGRVIEDAKVRSRKAICFVTGVPGSGKTLAGLNIATQRMQTHAEEHAVFLSGNGPLVNVLREALARDALERIKAAGESSSHAAEYGKASAFVQNIHHFRDEALESSRPPIEKVVVFDEAQRAWNAAQAAKFMREKRGQADFQLSEPTFLLSVMDRHPDWCVVVCLVGEGQEINTGEAGIQEWLRALASSFPAWEVHYSGQLLGSDHLTPGVAAPYLPPGRAVHAAALHLAVSIRSFRAEKLSQFVGEVIGNDPERARVLVNDLDRYPLVMTRSLPAARDWLRKHRRADERAGLLASSNGLRLKPYGIFVRAKAAPEDWFLAPREDVRSSDALEDVATEFEVQGLELDWACLCWDANLRRSTSGWDSLRFVGTAWQTIRDPDRRSFLLNAYRVLLTRARQGMILFVPTGDPEDLTRPPPVFDAIASFLEQCGVRLLT